MYRSRVGRPTARLWQTLVCVPLLIWLGAVQAEVPEAVSDFAKIAEGGFTKTVDGSFFIDPAAKRGFPSLIDNFDGQTTNTYAWAGAAKGRDLYIATNIDAVCLGTGGSGCEVSLDGGAQIWKYRPSVPWRFGDWGLSGRWELVYQSPAAVPWWLLSFADLLGLDLGLPDALPGGLTIEDLPRDLGYRNMTVCRAKDRVERIYVATAGIPGNILYQTWRFRGETFKTASTVGLNASLFEFLSGGPLDIGYRSLVCFKGRVITAPAGSLQDPDAPTNPVILMNADPVNPRSPWVEIANVKTEPGIGEETHQGVFEIVAVGDFLYASVGDRTNGFDLWQGDGRDCREPWSGDGRCNITWRKILGEGAGRPGDRITKSINNNPDFVASPGATLGVFGNDLYVAPTESGFASVSFTELFRCKNAHTPDPQCDLLIGWPRQDWGQAGDGAPEHFHCTNNGDMVDDYRGLSATERALWALVDVADDRQTNLSRLLISLDNDELEDDCLPATGAGPGYATSWEPDATGDPSETLAYSLGPYQYFWRFATLAASPPQFYLGTFEFPGVFQELIDTVNQLPGVDLDAGYVKPGFDLLRTEDGETFEAVTRDGLGSGPDGNNNYGVRTLLEVPGLGLAVGSANPDPSQGTDIYIGTRRPSGVAPFADAGLDQFLRDPDPANPTSVEAALNAEGSHSSFDGGTPIDCEWFEGESDLGCSSGDLAFIDAPASCDDDVTVELDTLVDGDRNPEYAFTVKVTDQDGRFACDSVVVTASSNQSPIVSLLASSVPLSNTQGLPPFVAKFGTNEGNTDNSQIPKVRQIDFDGDDSESYQVEGRCDDPDSPLLYVCQFETRDDGNTVSAQTLTCDGGATTLPAAPPCTVTATVTTLTPTAITETFGSNTSRPDMYLVAEDENRRTRVRWESHAQEIETTAENDDPICRSVVVQVTAGQDLVLDPTSDLADQNPVCVDPDGDTMTFGVIDGGYGPFATGASTTPAAGAAADSTITYTAPAAAGVDKFEIQANDASDSSAEAAILVEIVEP